MHLAERIGVTVARHSAGGDRRLQLRASLVVGVESGFEVVTLELCFGVKERRIGSRVTRAEGVGAATQAPEFGFKFVHRGLSSEKWCHAASLRTEQRFAKTGAVVRATWRSDCCGVRQNERPATHRW